MALCHNEFCTGAVICMYGNKQQLQYCGYAFTACVNNTVMGKFLRAVAASAVRLTYTKSVTIIGSCNATLKGDAERWPPSLTCAACCTFLTPSSHDKLWKVLLSGWSHHWAR